VTLRDHIIAEGGAGSLGSPALLRGMKIRKRWREEAGSVGMFGID
jgi:hypothetical protein